MQPSVTKMCSTFTSFTVTVAASKRELFFMPGVKSQCTLYSITGIRRCGNIVAKN